MFGTVVLELRIFLKIMVFRWSSRKFVEIVARPALEFGLAQNKIDANAERLQPSHLALVHRSRAWIILYVND